MESNSDGADSAPPNKRVKLNCDEGSSETGLAASVAKAETKVDNYRMESHSDEPVSKRVKYSDESNSVRQSSKEGLLNFQSSATEAGSNVDDRRMESNIRVSQSSKDGLVGSSLLTSQTPSVALSGTKMQSYAPVKNSVGQCRKEGLAASLLKSSGMGCCGSKGDSKVDGEFLDLPHSVLKMTASGLRCDLIIAGLLSHGLLETVLCVPKGLVNVPVRLSKGLLNKSNTCEVSGSE